MFNIPNLLSLSRLPLAVVLFVGISCQLWLVGLIAFTLAAITDWMDGWWARRFQQLTPIGRHLDPLTDKVLLNGAFIFMMTDPSTEITAWMVTVIVTRELLVTGIRGIVEATGAKFGADWFGKLKTVLQFTALFGILIVLALKQHNALPDAIELLTLAYRIVLWAMLIATVGSGLQYGFKARRILSGTSSGITDGTTP